MRTRHAAVFVIFLFVLGAAGACKRRPVLDDAPPTASPPSTSLPTQIAAPCPGCAAVPTDGVWKFEGRYTDPSCTTPVATADFGACAVVEVPPSPRVRFAEAFGRRKASDTEPVVLLHQLGAGEVARLFRKADGDCVLAKETAEITPTSCDGKRVCRGEPTGPKLACDGCQRLPNGCIAYAETRAYIAFAGHEPGLFGDLRPGVRPLANGHPSIRQGATQVNGRLPPEIVQRVVRQHFSRFRLCYESGLRTNPNLQGRVSVKFVIDRQGHVSTAADGGSDMPDPGVVSCVVRAFSSLNFPEPEGGIVTVVYPIVFAPAD